MDLAKLGRTFRNAFDKRGQATVINEEELDAMLKEVCTPTLIESDVHIRRASTQIPISQEVRLIIGLVMATVVLFVGAYFLVKTLDE
ncbi:hypothetical protein PRIPAC_74701 [Pristionchus pacificus]|uniref:SRP54_N domain-containing protein n=1 Tax=Pristionchus pacificus TaxID=54126 RepID=A0A2A6CFL7_PRIPA|nr:hypothetical protein PRIPAC_74701 [Pristionchus pacificus]|eukprot:PDM77002.1 hypothetical protein PRIPAC_42397 [Pristionchus pacificus]